VSWDIESLLWVVVYICPGTWLKLWMWDLGASWWFYDLVDFDFEPVVEFYYGINGYFALE